MLSSKAYASPTIRLAKSTSQSPQSTKGKVNELTQRTEIRDMLSLWPSPCCRSSTFIISLL